MRSTPESIQQAEQRLRQAMLCGDVAELDALLADDLRAVGPDGTLIGKAEDLAAHRSGTVRFTAIDIRETVIQEVPDVTIAFVLADLRVRVGGQAVAGRYRYTRVWSEVSGSWQVVAAHISGVA
jgi:ketosteroid isomerase-like protein